MMPLAESENLGVAAREPRICPLTTQELVAKILDFVELIMFTANEQRLYTYQRLFAARVIESILLNDGAHVTALWSRQSGKTEVLADLAVGLCTILPALGIECREDKRLGRFHRGFRVGIFAPVQDQALISFNRMRTLVAKKKVQELFADPDLDIVITGNKSDTILFSNRSVIRAKTASPEAQIEGFTYDLVFLEEAQKLLQSKVEKEIRPMLTSTAGSVVSIGTALDARGGFHTDIQKNLEHWKRTGQRNHFEFPYDKVIAEKRFQYEWERKRYLADPANNPPPNEEHLNYERYINSEIARLGGVDTLEFKMNYRCLWNESRVIAVSMDTLERLKLYDFEAGPTRVGYQVAGLDVGKSRDNTVLTIMHVDMDHPVVNMVRGPDTDDERQIYYTKTILDWLELDGAFEGSDGQYQMIVTWLRQFNVKVLCIDATGKGDVVAERLEAMLGDSLWIERFVYSLPTKSNGFRYYLAEMHAGRILFPFGPLTRQTKKCERFCNEHLTLDRYSHGNHIIVSAPEDMESIHDDYPNSGMLGAWAEKIIPDVTMPDISVSGGKGSSLGGFVQSSGPPKGRNRYQSGRRW